MRRKACTFALARFSLEGDLELAKALTGLGMGIAFGESAAFSGMASGLSISQVKRKTYVAISAQGTGAAAAIAVVLGLPGPRPRQPFQMVVDHPLLCAVRDNRTGTVVFIGAIMAPG